MVPVVSTRVGMTAAVTRTVPAIGAAASGGAIVGGPAGAGQGAPGVAAHASGAAVRPSGPVVIAVAAEIVGLIARGRAQADPAATAMMTAGQTVVRGPGMMHGVIAGGRIGRRGVIGPTSRVEIVADTAMGRAPAPAVTVTTVGLIVTVNAVRAEAAGTTRAISGATPGIATATAVASEATTTGRRAPAAGVRTARAARVEAAAGAKAPAVMTAAAVGAKAPVATDRATGGGTARAAATTAAAGGAKALVATIEAAPAAATVLAGTTTRAAVGAQVPAATSAVVAAGARAVPGAMIEAARDGARMLPDVTTEAVRAGARALPGATTEVTADAKAPAATGEAAAVGVRALPAATARATTAAAAAGGRGLRAAMNEAVTSGTAALAATMTVRRAGAQKAGVPLAPTVDDGPPTLIDRAGSGPARAAGSSAATTTTRVAKATPPVTSRTVVATAPTARRGTRIGAVTAIDADRTTGMPARPAGGVGRRRVGTAATADRMPPRTGTPGQRAHGPATSARVDGRTPGRIGAGATGNRSPAGGRTRLSGREECPRRRFPTRSRRLRWTRRPAATSAACKRILPRRWLGTSSRPGPSSTTTRLLRSPMPATRAVGRLASRSCGRPRASRRTTRVSGPRRWPSCAPRGGWAAVPATWPSWPTSSERWDAPSARSSWLAARRHGSWLVVHRSSWPSLWPGRGETLASSTQRSSRCRCRSSRRAVGIRGARASSTPTRTTSWLPGANPTPSSGSCTPRTPTPTG